MEPERPPSGIARIDAGHYLRREGASSTLRAKALM
jgi:hypothetical protein